MRAAELANVAAPLFSGFCQGHFGELLQGMFLDEDGKAVRGLVTLPYPELGSQVICRLDNTLQSRVTPEEKTKVRQIADIYCQYYDLSASFHLEVNSNIPVALGLGSSTADLVATIRALDQAFHINTSVADMLQMLLKVEAACDSTMFGGNALLFAQRDGRIIEDFGVPLMPLQILCFNLMPGKTFSTDEIAPASYNDEDIAGFECLRKQLHQGLLAGSAKTVAEVATQSALINQRYFPKPWFDELLSLGAKLQALGVCVAHSGTVAGLLFKDRTGLHEGRKYLRADSKSSI